MKANLLLPLLMLFASWGAVGQLPNFTLSATSTAQTCLGNGSLAFTVNGTDPDASMAYQIFLLPNITIPVATVNTPVAPNLIAGDYLVIATQTLGTESNTAMVNVTIEDEAIPLQYTLSREIFIVQAREQFFGRLLLSTQFTLRVVVHLKQSYRK